MSSQRRGVSGTAVQRTIAVLGSAVFFVVAPCTLAGLVPWSITGWQLRPRHRRDNDSRRRAWAR